MATDDKLLTRHVQIVEDVLTQAIAPISKLLTTDVSQLLVHLFAPVQRFGLEARTSGPVQRLDQLESKFVGLIFH
jgi:hypothetical protein